MPSPQNPSCLVISTHYQVCNHLTISVKHARLKHSPGHGSIHHPKRRAQSLIKCPQAIYNLSLFPPPTAEAQIQTTRCLNLDKRTHVNGAYGCPYCEPDMQRSGEDVPEILFEDSDAGDSNEAKTKRRVRWCGKVIEEWEKKNKGVPQAEEMDLESQCWKDAELALSEEAANP